MGVGSKRGRGAYHRQLNQAQHIPDQRTIESWDSVSPPPEKDVHRICHQRFPFIKIRNKYCVGPNLALNFGILKMGCTICNWTRDFSCSAPDYDVNVLFHAIVAYVMDREMRVFRYIIAIVVFIAY